MAESKEEFPIYMAMVSNPMRKRILEVLRSFPSLPYLKLMSECHLSHPSHCGVFTYHLRKLIDTGAVAKRKDEYSLTSRGRDWIKLTEKMEVEYMKKESGEVEFDLEKWCPFCLETHLKAKVSPELVRIKCKNPRCIVGGPIDKPPFYMAIDNQIPDWREKGLDIYDLVQKIGSKATPEKKMEVYQTNKCPKCGSENLIMEEFGPWFNKHCKDCDEGWGWTIINPWEFPETVAFLRTHHRVAETMLNEKVTVDGKTCWGIVCTDLDTNEKLVMYADVETFRPVKVCIDFEGKPVEGEMTTEQLVEKFLSFKKA